MSSLAAPPPSATLATNERVQARLAAGEPVLHLAFGEAGYRSCPASPSAWAPRRARTATDRSRARLRSVGGGRATSSGAGCPPGPSRSSWPPAASRCSTRLLAVLPGDVVLPRPSWVSYAAQAALAGKRVIDVPIAAEAGGVPDPAALREALAAARAAGQRPGILVLTVPDNPTGTRLASLVDEVCEVAGSTAC